MVRDLLYFSFFRSHLQLYKFTLPIPELKLLDILAHFGNKQVLHVNIYHHTILSSSPHLNNSEQFSFTFPLFDMFYACLQLNCNFRLEHYKNCSLLHKFICMNNRPNKAADMNSYPVLCILNNSDGTILSMWVGFQILHCKSSVTVFRTTPCRPWSPEIRSLNRHKNTAN